MRIPAVFFAALVVAALFAPECLAQKEKLEEVVVKTKKGKVFQKFQKKGGKMHGDFEEYWVLDDLPDDYLLLKGQHTDGKRSGTWTHWPMWNVPKKKRVYEYANDKLNGKYTSYGDQGDLEWTGEYKEGKESGEWTQLWPNGLVREKGQMVDGLREGNWIAELSQPLGGTSYEGPYIKGKKDGLWKGYSLDRKLKLSEGWFVNDLAEAEWLVFFVDGKTRMKVTYAKGIPNGPFCEWYENGQKRIEGEYRDGMNYQGAVTAWYKDGKVESMGAYEKGKPVGKAARFWESGEKSWEKNHDTGAETSWNPKGLKTAEDTGGPEGSRITFHENGAKKLERKRKKNIEVLEIEYYDNGQKMAEGPTHEKDRSKRDGKWKFWYSTGEKEAEGEMCLYGRIGKWTEFHKNGKKKSEGQWFSAYDRLENKVTEVQILKWTWWDESGKESKTENFPDPRKEKLPKK